MAQEGKDRLEARGSWTSWSEFLFAIMGSLIGYGNVWRFPYVCFRNGGGAFLLPFFISIFICGVPLMLLETSYSQYSNYGPGRVWEVCPLFKGIGLCMMTIVFIVSIYYTLIIAWTVYYFVHSFADPIPWTTCSNAWNSVNCTDSLRSDVNESAVNSSLASIADSNVSKVSSAEEFWFNKTLEVSAGIDTPGVLKWELLLCLLAAWTVTFLCLVKGIHSLGKVAYVAASLPYVILTVFLIRGCLLPGADKGLYYFIVPRWELLAQLSVWRDAATQMFYSIGIALGTVATLASYNKFHNNCYRDALILPLLDSFTSIFAGLVIFTYLGYTAHLTNKDVEQVLAQGPGLVFIAYPAALATLPLPQLWSVLFFLMLFAMGLDSQFVHVEALITAVLDCFPHLLKKKLLVTFVLCAVSFAFGLPLTTQAGVYILNLLDWYIGSVALLLTSAIECLVLAWLYGTDRLYADIEQMIGYRPPIIFKYSWKYISPAFVLFLWVSGFVHFGAISSKQPGFDTASDYLGLVVAILPILAVPGMAVAELYRTHGRLAKRLGDSLKPTSLWRPAVYKGVDAEVKDGVTEGDARV